MNTRLFRGLALLLWLVVAGCYHLRLAATPLEEARFSVKLPEERVMAAVKFLLQQDGYTLESADEREGIILTDYRNFSTKAGGVTLPEGGRLYYHKLKVTIGNSGAETVVALASVDLEIRSSYVYEDDGRVQALKKRYPYEQYPGMFDLSTVTWELKRVSGYLQTGLRREAKNGY